MPSSWCLIESDPAVFTELVQKLGVQNVSVEEVVTMDVAELAKYENVYGLIFLFKWNAATKEAATSAGGETNTLGSVVKDAPVYFAKQVVTNACATVALVNTLGNCCEGVNVGDSMSNFYAFTNGLDPETRGQQIDDFEPLRAAHNSFAPAEVFDVEGPSSKDDDVYHFVAFIFKNNCIWQLDGLQEGPVLCADATEANYKSVMLDVVQHAIADVAAKDNTGSGQGISFALMAVVDDPIVKTQEKIDALRAEEKPVPADLTEELETLKHNREKGRQENIRRRHNYIPTVVELLKALAEKGQLQSIVDVLKSSKKDKDEAENPPSAAEH